MFEHHGGNGSELAKLVTPTRNRYFYGKLLTARHFELEQKYFTRKRWLLNRLTLGSGVICGLSVKPAKGGHHLCIGPGVAVDQLGREIVVPNESRDFDPREVTDACGQSVGQVTGSGTVYICLAYHECEAEPVPVLVGDCDTKEGCAASTVRERYRVLVREGEPPQGRQTCQLPDKIFGLDNLDKELHTWLVDRTSHACPEVGDAPCVVLARVDLPEKGKEITWEMIDPRPRPLVHGNDQLFELLLCLAEQVDTGEEPDQSLTRVADISWRHDGVMEISEFMEKGLLVYFDGIVQATTKSGQAWFIVTLEYPISASHMSLSGIEINGTILVQHVLAKEITLTDDGNNSKAFFRPLGAFKETFRRFLDGAGTGEALCRVVLKCDYLMDGEERAADGDFLGGKFPSGNGIAGGDFESWFFLRPDQRE